MFRRSLLAVRLAGEHGAEELLARAREQVRVLVRDPDFRAKVALVAAELLRRRTLTGDELTEILNRPEAERTDTDRRPAWRLT